MVRLFWVVCIFWAACSPGFGDDLEDEAKSIRVRISTAKDRFVVGEPVVLSIRIEFTGAEELKLPQLPVENHEPLIAVDTATEAGEFQRCEVGLYGIEDPWDDAQFALLSRTRPWCLRMAVLHSERRPDRLAFSEPGSYRIRVRMPLYSRRALAARRFPLIASNELGLTIGRPEGEDIAVWRMLRTPLREYTQFVHSTTFNQGRTDDARKVSNLFLDALKRSPQGAYSATLRQLLRRYWSTWHHQLPAGEDKELRKLLDIPPDGPFPGDTRLDKVITVGFPKKTDIDDVMAAYTRLGGVQLTAAPDATGGWRISIVQTETLRQTMASHDNAFAEWIKDGDGYRLVRRTTPKEPPPPPYAACEEPPPEPAIAEIP